MNLERVENISEAVIDKSKDAVTSMKESIGKFDELSNKEKMDTAINWVKANPGKSAIIGLGVLVTMRSRTVRGAAMWAGATVGTYLVYSKNSSTSRIRVMKST